ncbi:MAG: SRPBCC family protein [Pseudomonadota bacterium]
MSIDVTSEIVINKAIAEVADFAANPDNVPKWYVNIHNVEWQTEPLLQVGSRISFEAKFIGRQLAYAYEVVEHEPGSRLIMRAADGPFEMETTYIWTATSAVTTRMTLRNYGEPAGFFGILSPLLAFAMKRAMANDLKKLKAILENDTSTSAG